MKKKIIISSVIIIAVIGIIVGIVLANNKKPSLEYQLETVSSIDYMLYSNNNKFGVINRNGDVLVQANYDEIQIRNPSKPVFICKYNYNPESCQYSIKVLNDKSEQILYQYVIVEAICLNTDVSNIPYEKSVLKFQDKGKYGLIDFQGKVILKPTYEEISSFDYNEGLLLVKKNGKVGIININGAVVVKEEYDLIESDAYYEEGAEYKKSAYLVANKNGETYKYGLLNHKGEKILDVKYEQIARIANNEKDDNIYTVAIADHKAGFYKNSQNIIPNEYDDISYEQSNNCLILEKDEKQGIADFSGKNLLEIKYDNIYISGKYINAQKEQNVEIIEFTTMQQVDIEGIVGLSDTVSPKYAVAITNDEKYKIYSKEKNEVAKGQYDYLEFLFENYFIKADDQKYNIIDSSGKNMLKRNYSSIQKIPNSNIVQATYGNKIDLIEDNKVIITFSDANILLDEKYITISSATDITYVSYSGEVIDNCDIIDRPMYAYKEKGKWGFKKKDGTIIVNAQYDLVTEFNEYGFAGIKLDNKWGVLNSEGTVILEPTYEIDSDTPSFVGKYYQYDNGYSEPYYISQDIQ